MAPSSTARTSTAATSSARTSAAPASSARTSAAPSSTAPTSTATATKSTQQEQSERLRAAIGKLSRRLRPTTAGAGLSPSQISVLFTVVRYGNVALATVADVEGLNASMLSRITAQLADAGLITREADPIDRRAVSLAPTAAGVRMRERIHRERTQALAKHVQLLSERERKLLWAALPVLEELAERLAGGSL